jgi:phage scaffold protein
MKHTDKEKGAFMHKFDFDLQRFADGDGTASDGGSVDADKGANGESKPKSDPPENKPDDTQMKIDAAVAARLAEAKAKWEKEYQKKATAEQKEKERLSKLSEDERKAAELENSRKELEAKEAELKKKELRLEMVKVLADRKIPVQFMDYLIAEDSESTLVRITTFEKAFKKAVEDGVNERLKGKAPAAGGTRTGENGAGVTNGFFDAIYKNQVKR